MKNGIKDFPYNLIELEFDNQTQDTITSGSLVQDNSGWAVLHEDALSGQKATAYRAGRYSYAKEAGVAVAQGQPIWWDAENSRLTPTSNGTPPVGSAPYAYGTLTTVMEVDINVFPAPATKRHTVTAAEAALNSNNGQVDIDTGFGVAPTAVNVQVRTVTTGRLKTGFDVELLTGNDIGKVRIKGVAAGTQLDENDVIEFVAHL
ncbi:MAG: DUF2190 family protein [Planctomycetota bacterium]